MRSDSDRPLFLFSVDLEDVRTMVQHGDRHVPRVSTMTHRYLEFLRRHRARCTFFVVGSTALAHRSLMAEILAEGHELACHTHQHRPLTEMTPVALRSDLARNVQALTDCGAAAVKGFRAPTFSLVKRTAWAYDVMAEFGFEYSSSVLPARNPLYGWKEFGTKPQRCGAVIELPMTLLGGPILGVPFAGGVYFRALPWWIVRSAFRRRGVSGGVVLSYFHPYDVDADQERFMHPSLKSSTALNWLMYRNRSTVFQRLEQVMALGYEIDTYGHFVESRLTSFAA